MKILLVNCVYGNGSTGKIIKALHLGLEKKGYDTIVFHARGPESPHPNVHKLADEKIVKFQALMSRISGYVYGCSPFTTQKLIKEIKYHKPDIVNLHCVNANTVNIPVILNFLKQHKIKTVITAHAEFFYTGGCGHAYDCEKWLIGCGRCPQFHGFNTQLPNSIWFDKTHSYWKSLRKAYHGFNNLRITGVSPWLVERMKKSPFFDHDKIFWATNGVDTSIFHPYSSEETKNLLGLNKVNRIYFHPTPGFESPLKGGNYILEFAKRLYKVNKQDKIIIIGRNVNNIDLQPNIIALNHTNNQLELARYYSMVDVTLLASSRETFSMVTAESLCCGTPVVGFKAGGPESICTKGHAKFVDYGNLEDFFKSATEIRKDMQISSEYSKIFSVEAMTEAYIKVYKSF